MAISFPYSLDFLWGILDPSTITVTLRRFDEESGSGDGRFWSAELSRPLWEVEASLIDIHWEEARRINARFRALAGMGGSMLFSDPSYEPEFDAGPDVTVSSISADRSALTLAGLPPFHGLRGGDAFSVAWGDGRWYYTEVAEDMMATELGVIGPVSVHPYVPLGLSAGLAVNLRTPTMKMYLQKDGFTPYSYTAGQRASGASIRLRQRV